SRTSQTRRSAKPSGTRNPTTKNMAIPTEKTWLHGPCGSLTRDSVSYKKISKCNILHCPRTIEIPASYNDRSLQGKSSCRRRKSGWMHHAAQILLLVKKHSTQRKRR